ncbi:HAD family hydrolase [Fimbriiglobus ruber]|uniref:Uncharacterized protein n=1 Tax=Fimbriiglobus ruber TaxID=1908690 RepID=A0A225E1D6_9BACT|nr:HAD family hydrolase [Fimbriiglobus ruber]OWK47013.1 hypothetical protein FRUB_00712 [Fimbriiglobus ruber]
MIPSTPTPSFVLPAAVRAVFFDAVGTVLHPEPGAPAVYADAAARYGISADPATVLERFRAAYLREEAVDARTGWATSEARELARWQTIVRETLPGAPAECFDLLYQHFANPAGWRVPDRAAEVFAALTSRGLILGLASNYDSRLDTVLAGRHELAALRDRVVVSSRLGVRKPGAAFFQHLLRVAACEPGEMLYVGDDRDNDFDGAAAAGLRAVLLDPKNRHPDVTPRITALTDLLTTALETKRPGGSLQ